MPRNAHTPDPNARGRAALSNRPGRFERFDRNSVDDGWEIDEDLPPVRTDVSLEIPRKIITRNTSPDVPFDRSINPYRGCEHGCIYCFARPTHAFLGLSPGLDFETRLIARPDAPELLAKELRARSYVPKVMAIGTNTDPYQPIEKEHRIMRRCLEVLRDFNHPVGIVTKGTLIERDTDILSDMAARNLVRVGISVTTLDARLSRSMEPRVPGPKRRLQTIRRLAEAGIPVRIQCAPVVPGLTDHELEKLLEAGKDAGAYAANWVMLRLPLEVAPLFKEWLEAEVPNKAAKVMARVR
ncbi:MAG: PA0069 family radical SAM protein, partial [Boseongicola sp.]|nr:PA0069 family radical SAM protein [Boseongicola sp.]